MKNLKVKFKLFALLAIVLATLIIISILALLAMSDITANTEEVTGDWLPAVIIAEELNTATSDFRVAEYAHVVSQSSQDMLQFEADLKKEEQNIDLMFTDYETNFVTNEEDKALIEQAKSMWANYLVVHDEMIAYSAQNSADEAMEILNDESKILFDEVSTVFTQLVEFNKDGADKASLSSARYSDNSRIFILSIAILGTIISLLFAFKTIKLITQPIEKIEEAANQILSGNLQAQIEHSSKDELGNLAATMGELCALIKHIIGDMDERLTGLANGDFTVKSSDESMYIGDFESLNTLIAKISRQLSDTLSEIDNASSQVSQGSDQISTASQVLAQGSVEQSSSIGQLLNELKNISEGAMVNAKNADNARIEAEKSNEKATQSSKQMEKMIESMNNIQNKSNKISTIISTIDDISFQTNILSLNAAVEAARAGNAGKGFSVVADEVRNLAIKSAQSATDTKALIDETIATIKEGTQIVDETAIVIKEVITAASSITELVGKIAVDSEIQQKSVEEVTSEVSEISNIVNSNAATSEETAASSEELSSQAAILKDLVDKFELLDFDPYGKGDI